MREIEEEMLSAISERRNWKSGNTEVIKYPNEMGVLLYDNHLAIVDENNNVKVNKGTVRRWPTNTTLSRLKALGVSVRRVNGVVLFDDTDE